MKSIGGGEMHLSLLNRRRRTKETPYDQPFAEIERCMYRTLETYANVHRGAGFKSLASTAVYEQSRVILLDAAGLDPERFELIFCHPGTEAELLGGQSTRACSLLSSADLGLPLGVRAVAVERTRIAGLRPPMAGGGTVALVSPRSVVRSSAPELLEAGTPAVVNIAAFASAAMLAKSIGKRVFTEARAPMLTAEEVLGTSDCGSEDGSELLKAFRHSLIGRHFPVPIDDGRTGYVNLDNAASTAAPWQVWDSARKALRQGPYVQREIVDVVKRELAAFLGAPEEEYDIWFTANTTGAINLAARALASQSSAGENAVIVNTWFEHNSNELPWRKIPGMTLRKIPMNGKSLIEMDRFERMLRQCGTSRGRGAARIALVAVSGASNVTGESADLETMCAVAHKHGAMAFVDGAQIFAHRPLDLKRTGIDFFSFSGHKGYAPFGAGALVVRRSCIAGIPAAISAMKAAGEENAVGIAAIGKAVRLLRRIGMDTIQQHESQLHRLLVSGFSSRTKTKVLSVTAESASPSTHCGGVAAFRVDGIPHNLAARLLAETGGIGTRSGCFCAHLFVKRLLGIHPLRALLAELLLRLFPTLMKPMLPGLVRVSVSAENDESDLASFFASLDRVMSIRQSPFARVLSRIGNGVPVLPDTTTGRKTRDAIQERLRRVFPTSSTIHAARRVTLGTEDRTVADDTPFNGVEYAS